MSIQRQHRRGSRTACEAITPADGEYLWDQTLKAIRAGDGATLGGLLLKKWGRSKIVLPAQITANQNDYNPTDLAIAETLYLDLDADRTLTGLAGGATDRDLTVFNSSAFRLTLANASTSSSAGNRFSFGSDVTLRPLQSARLFYVASLSRWLILDRADLGITQLPEDVSLPGDITPTQISSNQNDYAPTGASAASRFRLSTDASRNVTGIAGGGDGRVLILVNVGSNPLVLKNADAGSTAGNRFDFGADCTLAGKQAAIIQYDATDSRWKLLSTTAGAAVAAGAVTAQTLSASAIASGVSMINGMIVESHSGNAATFAIKTQASNGASDPSSGDPVFMVFPAAGGYAVRTLTAALSLVVSGGSSLGIGSATPFRVWLGAFDDAGTVRLWARTFTTVGKQTRPLLGAAASSTAEGGAGAADSAHTYYTGSAVTSKRLNVLGYASYESGLATAGIWVVAPDDIVLWGAGVPLPGDEVQSASASSTTKNDVTATALTATDLTVPITPSSKCNPVYVRCNGTLWVNTGSDQGTLGLMRNGTQFGIQKGIFSTSIMTIDTGCEATDFPGLTSSITYAAAIAISSSGHHVFYPGNGTAGNGGVIEAVETMA